MTKNNGVTQIDKEKLTIPIYLNTKIVFDMLATIEDPYEIYFSFGIMYGIVYAKEEEAYEKREQMKADLEQEYRKNKEPSKEFINSFAKKYDVCLPSDVIFNEDAFMEAFMNIWESEDAGGREDAERFIK